jgi:hypothetical protein
MLIGLTVLETGTGWNLLALTMTSPRTGVGLCAKAMRGATAPEKTSAIAAASG